MDVSDNDKQYIENQSRDNQVHQYFDNVIPYDFKVGDYLIRLIRDFYPNGQPKGDWRVVKISPKSPINKKFKVVYVDKYGVPYVKHIKVNGELGGIICMASMNFQQSKFEPDPEHMDHIILDGGDNFEPLATYKESKE